jgi:hypothetical protein
MNCEWLHIPRSHATPDTTTPREGSTPEFLHRKQNIQDMDINGEMHVPVPISHTKKEKKISNLSILSISKPFKRPNSSFKNQLNL